MRAIRTVFTTAALTVAIADPELFDRASALAAALGAQLAGPAKGEANPIVAKILIPVLETLVRPLPQGELSESRLLSLETFASLAPAAHRATWPQNLW